jgi:hypothetical protein
MHKDVNYLLKLIPRYHTENPDVVIWIRDPTWQYQLYITPAYEDVWGRTCASLYNDPLKWSDTLYYADRHKRSVPAVLKGIEENKSIDFVEVFRIVKPDNSVHCIEDRCFPLVDVMGKHLGFAGISEDITAKMHEKKREYLPNRTFLNHNTFSLSALVRQLTISISIKKCFKEKIFFNTTIDKKIPLFLKADQKKLQELLECILTQSMEENKISTIAIEFKMINTDKVTKEIKIRVLLKSKISEQEKEVFPPFDIMFHAIS